MDICEKLVCFDLTRRVEEQVRTGCRVCCTTTMFSLRTHRGSKQWRCMTTIPVSCYLPVVIFNDISVDKAYLGKIVQIYRLGIDYPVLSSDLKCVAIPVFSQSTKLSFCICLCFVRTCPEHPFIPPAAMTRRLIVSLALAGSIRYLLMVSHYSQTIKDRVEVATPLNSWKRGEWNLVN